jgi:hypothetical protein
MVRFVGGPGSTHAGRLACRLPYSCQRDSAISTGVQ